FLMKPTPQRATKLSIAFAGRPELELQTPALCDWAKAQFVTVEADWDPALAKIEEIAADVCILFDPYSLGAAQLARAPGLKIGVLTRKGSHQELERLKPLVSERGFRWFTYPEPVEAEGLPILQTLPPLVDAARLPSSPDWAPVGRRVLALTAEPV